MANSQDYEQEKERLEKFGKLLIGRKAQSTLLTMLSPNGQNIVMEPAQKITAYEIVENFMEPELMVILGGESVYESTLRLQY